MSKIRNPKSIRHDLTIQELGKTISIRALKVGEQKALLTAMGLKDAKALINCIVDIVEACTFGEIDLSKTPMHIVDYIFLHVYIKSSGNMSPAEFTCGGTITETVTDDEGNTTEETKPCGARHQINLNLDRTLIKYPDGYQPSKLIDLGDGMHVKMRVPSFESFKKLELDKDSITDITDQFIYSSIECIVDGDDVKTPGLDFTFDDMVEWINSLDSSIMDEINSFFQGTPKLSLEVPVTCPKCGRKEVFELTELEDFFG